VRATEVYMYLYVFSNCGLKLCLFEANIKKNKEIEKRKKISC